MSTERLHPDDMRAKRVYWLLDLIYAGQTYRLSDGEFDLEDDSGSYHYMGGLGDVQVEESIDFLSDASASTPSAAIEAHLPDDVALLVSQGHDLAGARGELCRWVEGTPYESRRKMISGWVSDPEYGAASEPISFSLESPPWEASGMVPDAAFALEGANWEDDQILSLPADELGAVYPVIVGNPGRVDGNVNSSGKVTGSQALPIWLDPTTDIDMGTSHGRYNVLWLIAGHHCSATRVYVSSDLFTSQIRVCAINGYDKRGHPVCLIPWFGLDVSDPDAPSYPYEWDPAVSPNYAYDIQPDTDGDDTWTAGTLNGWDGSSTDDVIDAGLQKSEGTPSIYVCWADTISEGGGMLGPDGSTMRGAGDVLQWLLQQAALPVDFGRFGAVRSALNDFKLDFTIDERVSAWDFIQSNLLPLLPCSIVSGPDGVYPLLWRYDALASDAICILDLSSDPTIERASKVSFDRTNIYNDFKLKYAYSIRKGTYIGSVRISADGTEGADPNIYCHLSQRRYKLPNGEPYISTKEISTTCVYDTQTAHAIVSWQARAYAFAKRRVDYQMPECTYGFLERGQVVALSDPDLHFNSQVALVESIRIDGSGLLRLRLLLIEDPVRDVHP